MKRKDWKKKNLKKDIYGNFSKSKRIFFLRKLFLKKDYKLKRKNYIFNFLFFNFMLKNIKKNKNNYICKNYLSDFNNINVLPIYSLNKKLFGLTNLFNYFIKTNCLDYMFIKSYCKLKKDGLNVVIYKNMKTNENLSIDFNDENTKLLILEKFNTPNKLNVIKANLDINFFFNYNLYIINSVEIYKILKILYINFYTNENN